ncbi:MAG: phosphotransferase [Magnetococcales bacterium]|nr:phosphotransferase [Magnetococcales bacterium]
MHSSSTTLNKQAQHVLDQWINGPWQATQVAGDASFRSYYRIHTEQGTRILMDAPPDKEDSRPFLDIGHFLKNNGVQTPAILQEDLATGHLLLEDFGDITFLTALEQGADAETLYKQAIEALITIQRTPQDGSCMAHQRPFDQALLRTELALFTDWFIEGIIGTPISKQDRAAFDAVFQTVIDTVLKQPVVLVHRDYHSRNLMLHDGQVGIIDFQDAVMGPVTYDLASLLRDCYVAWDQPFRDKMMSCWQAQLPAEIGYAPESPEAFQRDFDFMALQRNLKAIGIFGRLSIRDGKHGYLEDIPRTMSYVREVLPNYPELKELNALVIKYVPEDFIPLPVPAKDHKQ